MATTARQLLRLRVLAILVCALVYVVALGTRWGLHADERAFPSGIGGLAWEHAHAALRRAVDTIHVATVVLAAVAVALTALLRRRFDLAAVAIATLAGANLTTHILKPLLAHADPLGGEAAALLLVPASHLRHGVFAVSAVAISAIALMLPVGLTVVLSGVRRASGGGSPPSSG